MVIFILIKLFKLLRHHSGKRLWLPKGNRQIDLRFDIILIAQQPKNEELYLDVGEYAYPFRFQMAQNISPSYGESYTARTRYFVVSTLGVDSFLDW